MRGVHLQGGRNQSATVLIGSLLQPWAKCVTFAPCTGETKMKNLVILSGLAILAACSKPAPTTDAASEPAVVASQADTSMSSAMPSPGTYQVKMPNGKTGTTTIKADGTYVDMAGGKETEMGAVASRGGKTCFAPKGGTETCFTDGPPSADGSWVSTNEKGEKYTITPPAKK